MSLRLATALAVLLAAVATPGPAAARKGRLYDPGLRWLAGRLCNRPLTHVPRQLARFRLPEADTLVLHAAVPREQWGPVASRLKRMTPEAYTRAIEQLREYRSEIAFGTRVMASGGMVGGARIATDNGELLRDTIRRILAH